MYAQDYHDHIEESTTAKSKILAYIDAANTILNEESIKRDNEESRILYTQLKKCMKQTYYSVYKDKAKLSINYHKALNIKFD